MIILTLSVITWIVLEIILDKYLWENLKNDKPSTTVIRLVILMITALWINVDGWDWHRIITNYIFELGIFFALFDFALNISRWKELNVAKKLIKRYLSSTRKYQHAIVSRKRTFLEKLFYHGINKKKWSYDGIMNRIPWYLELFLKIWVAFVVVIDYYRESFIDWLIYLVV